MKVSRLIELLQRCDPNANVKIMSQPRYPIEYSVYGITARTEFDDSEFVNDKDLNDVFILEGDHEAYGDRNAWDAVQR